MPNIFEATISKVGSNAERFLDEGLILIFSVNDVMSEIKEYSILIDDVKFKGHIKPGQYLYLDDKKFKIISVGDIAEKNLREINHVTFKSVETVTESTLPGTIYLEKKRLPKIVNNSSIKIKAE